MEPDVSEQQKAKVPLSAVPWTGALSDRSIVRWVLHRKDWKCFNVKCVLSDGSRKDEGE